MNARGSVLTLTASMVVTTLVSGASAQLRFTLAAPIPRPEIGSPEQRAQPLFPVQPFEVPKAPQPVPPQADPATPVPPPASPDTLPNLKPRVVCGMTLIPTVPTVDPKMALKQQSQQPKNPTTYTIRPVQPTLCW